MKRPESAPQPGRPGNARPLDAYYASYGDAVQRLVARTKSDYQLESILGTDDRTRIKNTQDYPWCCICSLAITAQTGTQWIGTGWLAGPRLLLTAGHCVYMANEGGWASQIEVIPGRDAAQRPFGSVVCHELRSVTGWTVDNDSNFDYGAILLPEGSRYGDQLGWFGFANRSDDYLRGLELNLSGYPGDGGRAPNDEQGSQWFNSRVLKEALERQLEYEIDTFGGQSGAPVWETAADGGRYGLGIHTHGGSITNGATRITTDVFDNIVLWAGQAP